MSEELGDASVGSDRLFGNTAVLVAGRVGIAVFGWAGTLLIVRNLSVDEFGRFTLIFGILGLMSVVTDMGTGRIAVAGVADERRDRARFAGAYIVLRSCLGVVGYLLAIVVVWIAGYPTQVVAVTAVAGVVVLLATPSSAMELAFQVRSNMRPVAVAGVASQLAQFGLTAAIAASGRATLLWFVLPAILYEVVNLLWKLRAARGLLPVELCVDVAAWKEILREAVPLAIGGALATVYLRIDTVMLSKMDSFASVGVYGVAYKFIGVANFVPASLRQSIMYPLVRQWQQDMPGFRDTIRRSYALLMATGALLVAELAVFAGDALGLLYGPGFEEAGVAAGLVMGGEFFVFFTILAYAVLIAMGRRAIYAYAAGTGVAVNVGLNLLLIRTLSYEGAAIATLVTNAVVAAMMWTALLRAPGLGKVGFWRAAGAVPLGAVTVAVGALARVALPWPVAAGVAALFFATALHLTRIPGPGGIRDLVRAS